VGPHNASMKMKRPATREIIPSNSNWPGQGDWRCRFKATLLNRSGAKIRRSAVAFSSASKSYRKCDEWVGASKKRWMSTSGLLVIIILSHCTCAAALVRAFRMPGRLWSLPHLSDESAILEVRKVADDIKEGRALHRFWCEVWVVSKTLCHNAWKRGEYYCELVDNG